MCTLWRKYWIKGSENYLVYYIIIATKHFEISYYKIELIMEKRNTC